MNSVVIEPIFIYHSMKRNFVFSLLAVVIGFSSALGQTFEWSHGAEALITASAYGIATDAQGNSVVIGSFYSMTAFDTVKLNSQGRDLFVARYNSDGKLLWAQRFGGPSDEFGNSVALDSKGNIYIAGSFTNKMQIGKDTLVSAGDHDAFIAKLTPDGEVLWARRGGGTNSDFAMSIAVDKDGNAFVAGYFRDTSTFGNFVVSPWRRSLLTMFFAKYDKNGKCEWAKPMGGSNYQSQFDGVGVDVDGSGNVYLGGCIRGEAYIDELNLTAKGMTDLFIAKFSPKGKVLWAKNAGAPNGTAMIKAVRHTNDHIAISGYYINDIAFDPKTTLSSQLGFSDLFIASYNEDGNFEWVANGKGRGAKIGEALSADAKGNLYMTGNFNDSLNFGSERLSSDGRQSLFVASFDPQGKFRFAKQSGRGGAIFSRAIGLDKADNIYIAGGYSDTASFGKVPLHAPATTQDMFVTKLSTATNWTLKILSDEPVTNSEMLSSDFNPKSSSLLVRFKVAGSQFVTLEFNDVLGNISESFVEQELTNGTYELILNLKKFPKQEYYSRLQIGANYKQTKRITLE